MIYCSITEKDKREPIYKFLELEGDPTDEEIAQMEREDEERKQKEYVATYEQYQKAGLI